MNDLLVTDQELVKRARGGDNAAFGALWLRHQSQVLALCRGYLGGPHRDPAVDEQDLATEAFIRALHGLDRYTDRSAQGIGFEAWLSAVARHVCLTFLAKQRRRRRWSAGLTGEQELAERPDPAASPAQVVTEREVLRLAALAINGLPELYRVPFKLLLEERSHKGIAETLGISVESAAKRVQRARRLLQPRLAPLLQPQAKGAAAGRRQRASLTAVEQALTAIVSDFRIVAITLPTGGEMQLCLRVDREKANRAPEIEARRARLQRLPRAWKQRLELAELCYHSGVWEAAQREYRAVLAIHPHCFTAALRLGQMLALEGKPAEAAQVYRAALGHEPPPAGAAQLQAHLLAAEGRNEAAVELYEWLVERQGCRNTGLLASWGHTLKVLNDPRAEALLAEASALARSGQDYQALARAYEACGEHEAAMAAYRRCLPPSLPPAPLRRRAEAALQRLEDGSKESLLSSSSAV